MESRMKLNMFDDYWIDFRRHADRRWFSPVKYSEIPAGEYGSLVYDRKIQKYRIYYETAVSVEKGDIRHLYLCESEDLLHFSEPVMVFDGGSGLHGCTVMIDDRDPDSERRYKFCGMTGMGDPISDQSKRKVEIAFSADGIHWKTENRIIVSEHTSDSMNKLYYNPIFGEYVCLHRCAFVDRRIAVRTSSDLTHWSEPRICIQPSSFYNDGYTNMQHYAMTAGYFDGIFLGVLWQYRNYLYDHDYINMSGLIEPELVYSYDGREYYHTTGKPLLERPEAPEPGCLGFAPFDLCESADGEYYYLFLSGNVFSHGTEADAAEAIKTIMKHHVHRANVIYRIRKDRFCGIENTCAGGEVITRKIQLLKDDLTFNINASVGTARFGLQNAEGDFLPGFSFDDCIPFTFEDGTAVRPRWKEKNLSEMVGKDFRIAVELNKATLYCISATARPFKMEVQKSFAEPVPAEE